MKVKYNDPWSEEDYKANLELLDKIKRTFPERAFWFMSTGLLATIIANILK